MASLICQIPRVISSLALLLLLGLPCFSQSITVTVVDDNEPLIGATIRFLDSKGELLNSNGTITDYDGTAIIPRLNQQDILEFSYIGYETKKMTYEDLTSNPAYKSFSVHQGFVIKLATNDNILATFTVTAPTKFDEKEASVPNKVQKISLAQIEHYGSQTSAEVIEKVGGFIQRSQGGGGSPIIRGFEANKVLIVVDGVRLNNAIFRNGHLQNIITVDNAMLNHMEILYGPAAVVYGSDALGGVLYMETKDPILANLGNESSKDSTAANAYVRYATSNNSVTTHFDFGTGDKKFGSITSITFSRFGDILAGKKAPNWRGDSIPDNWLRNQYVGITNNDDIVIDGTFEEINPYLQRGTSYGQSSRIGYWQMDLLQKFQYRPSEYQSHIFNIQYSSSNNIQRYDQLSKLKNGKPKFAEWYYGPQKRALISHTAKILKDEGKMFNRALFVTAFQRIGEDRYQRKLNNLLLERNLVDVNVYSFNMDFMKEFGTNKSQTLFYGTELTYNYVISKADFTNIVTKEIIGGNPTRYGNAGNNMSTMAAYVNYRKDFKKKDIDGKISESSPTLFRVLTGLRYTYAATTAKYEVSSYAPSIPYEKVAIQKGNVTGAVGFSFTPKDWAFKTSFSTGFRVPNVDDLAKFREKDGFVTIPNPDLQSEYALNYEFNLARTFKFGEEGGNNNDASSMTISGTFFYSHLLNAIVRKAHHLPNRDTIINGQMETIQGDSIYNFEGTEANVVINTNAASANIMGYSLNLSLNIKDQWLISAGYNDIKGQYISGIIDDVEVETERPLSHIPPSYGQISLGYQFKGKKERKWHYFKTELLVRFNGVKPLREYDSSSGNSDNLDDAIEDFGTPKWYTWNVYNTWRFSRKFSLNFNVENIADLHYRVFSSGISAPGRNFVITLKGVF